MIFARYITLIIVAMCLSEHVFAQDTFYVKKNPKRAATISTEQAAIDSSENDSIVSYTLQYQKANSNIWIVRHEKGPYINVPSRSEYAGRVFISEIIAVDKNGRKYRQPDRYYSGGIWVDAPKK